MPREVSVRKSSCGIHNQGWTPLHFHLPALCQPDSGLSVDPHCNSQGQDLWPPLHLTNIPQIVYGHLTGKWQPWSDPNCDLTNQTFIYWDFMCIYLLENWGLNLESCTWRTGSQLLSCGLSFFILRPGLPKLLRPALKFRFSPLPQPVNSLNHYCVCVQICPERALLCIKFMLKEAS